MYVGFAFINSKVQLVLFILCNSRTISYFHFLYRNLLFLVSYGLFAYYNTRIFIKPCFIILKFLEKPLRFYSLFDSFKTFFNASQYDSLANKNYVMTRLRKFKRKLKRTVKKKSSQ
jgi:hypothetical protein